LAGEDIDMLQIEFPTTLILPKSQEDLVDEETYIVTFDYSWSDQSKLNSLYDYAAQPANSNSINSVLPSFYGEVTVMFRGGGKQGR
jgi:hypothetical protein